MKFNLLLLLFVLQFPANAQEFSYSIDIGYANHLSPRSANNSMRIAEWETAYETVVYSYGKGLNFNATAEYYPKNSAIGFGLLIGQLQSSEVVFIDMNEFDVTYTIKKSANMFRFSPFIKFKVEKEKVQYFTKFGYVVGALGNIVSERIVESAASDSYSKNQFDGGFAHGVMAGVGLNYKITDRLQLLGEVRMIAQSYAPTKGELIASTTNGQDRLPDLDVINIHTEYTDSHITNWEPNSVENKDLPSQSSKIHYPFSGVGINIGVAYLLIKKEAID